MKLTKWLTFFAILFTFAFAISCMANKPSTKPSSGKESEILSVETTSESESLAESDISTESEFFESDESLNESESLSESESINESFSFNESESKNESTSESESSKDDKPVIDDYAYYLEADDKYVAIDVQNKISTVKGEMSFITKIKYRGIKRIVFNAKTGDVASWWGFALADSARNANVYNTDLASYKITNGYWMTFIYEFSGTGCTIYTTYGAHNPKNVDELTHVPYSADEDYYIHFVGPLWETFSEPVCIDNFTVELIDGTVYTDTFDDGIDACLFNADEAVSYVLDDTIIQLPEEIPETALYETNEIFYDIADEIDFTAYAPVTVANWAGSGTSNPNLVTDEQYRYMAEAGFTKSLGLYEGRSGDSGLTSNEKAEKDALAVLEQAEKHGIKYYVLNEKFYNFVRPDINLDFFNLTQKDGVFYNSFGEEVSSFDSYKYLKSNWQTLYKRKLSAMFNATTKYIDSIAYGGNFASDEPALPVFENGEWYYGELEQIYYQLLYYNDYVSANSLHGGEAYVNLNPYYSVNDNNRARYDAMLEYYFENIAPLIGYVSYDHYPLNTTPTETGSAYVSAAHLLNLEMMANYCKKYGVELRSFLWSKIKPSAGHRAMLCANDLRFQAYANLAFGVKEMPYYTYFNYYAQGGGSCDSLIDCQTGARSKAYFWAKEVNNEIHSFEKAYLSFDWVGSMRFDVGVKSQQLSLLETSLLSHERLTDIQSTTDVLVGVFTDNDGKRGATDGFVVMNYYDPYYAIAGAKKNVALTFANATHAIVYKNGKQYEAKLENGVLSTYLESGEGIFVIPFVK